MSRITNLINSVRIDLGDINNPRYSDDILISYLNDGILDFVASTKCLKERIFMGLSVSNAIYDLRPYVLEVLRVEYMYNNIEAKSFSELDLANPDWQLEVGTEVKYVTFDNLPQGMLRVYPRITGALDIIEQNSLYGGIIDITINDDSYQIPSIADVEQNIEKYLILYCIKKPKVVTINTLDSALELNSTYDLALQHYIKYRCLRSDTDVNNRNYGNEELQLYTNYVNGIRNSNAKANNIVNDRIVRYNGGF